MPSGYPNTQKSSLKNAAYQIGKMIETSMQEFGDLKEVQKKQILFRHMKNQYISPTKKNCDECAEIMNKTKLLSTQHKREILVFANDVKQTSELIQKQHYQKPEKIKLHRIPTFNILEHWISSINIKLESLISSIKYNDFKNFGDLTSNQIFLIITTYICEQKNAEYVLILDTFFKKYKTKLIKTEVTKTYFLPPQVTTEKHKMLEIEKIIKEEELRKQNSQIEELKKQIMHTDYFKEKMLELTICQQQQIKNLNFNKKIHQLKQKVPSLKSFIRAKNEEESHITTESIEDKIRNYIALKEQLSFENKIDLVFKDVYYQQIYQQVDDDYTIEKQQHCKKMYEEQYKRLFEQASLIILSIEELEQITKIFIQIETIKYQISNIIDQDDNNPNYVEAKENLQKYYTLLQRTMQYILKENNQFSTKETIFIAKVLMTIY
ncbi:hypothetical protein AB837_00073 [bacterium AB1]|nr:hypothetical protein AB837_00073 [bacterium AB1]